MVDKITVTKTNSFGSRIKSSLKGIVWWFVLIIVAIWLLYRNEWSSFKTIKSLDEVSENVITVYSSSVDDLNDWKLVYVNWKVATDDKLSDVEFGIIDQENIIKLIRKVEIYQWEEESHTTTKEKIGWAQEETTTYTYKKVWSDDLIDSSDFYESSDHQNPTYMEIEPIIEKAENVQLWEFELSSDQIEKMGRSKSFKYEEKYLESLNDGFKKYSALKNNKLYVWNGDKPNASSPKIWDIRISWEYVPIDEVSIIAQQSSNSFRWYQTKAWQSISMINQWNQSPEAMISWALKSNSFKTWALRILWIILMIMWFKSILSILPTLTSVLPIFGRVVWAGVSLVSFVLWLSFWLLTIAISWLRYRPVAWIVLIIVSIWLVVLAKFYKKSNKKNKKK